MTQEIKADAVRRNVLEVFNADDDGSRRELIESLYHPDAVFYEAESTATGRDAIVDAVRALHENTAGLTFSVAIEPTVIADLARISWALSPPDGPAVVTGMDVVVFDGDKISKLYTFLDPQ
ncbi:nuclear transport factor 2 family protein [Rhodococcus sp. P1Y]|uniref:nuclear transport factor 2 family protein n=1 Tax=Rhodococcus sp. P1Y TaxID=1302308 RepID=UPI000EACE295|nr:nuclear transport factor 2 family protein [Rhodococcus sp. P1Y]AYJ50963.1 nuclear transport factor 2 family protein [Rhodococcus sp. P1Y]